VPNYIANVPGASSKNTLGRSRNYSFCNNCYSQENLVE
jgi:hypothetical protein